MRQNLKYLNKTKDRRKENSRKQVSKDKVKDWLPIDQTSVKDAAFTKASGGGNEAVESAINVDICQH